jgi:lipid A ethanolaminephosphotransferase
MLVATSISYKNIVVIHRNNRKLARVITPMNWVYYLGKFIKKNQPAKDLINVGLDASKGQRLQETTKKTLLVIVIGEAARSGNFSLNGYKKETNPLLKTKNVISFKDVTSCATCTATALPGIFSRLPRTNYSPEKATAEENLLDILARVGFSIRWRDNNSSSKNVAFRFNEENIRELNQNDEALLEGLDEYIGAIKNDSILVLHQLGSHGPAYYKRYPDQFDQFKPGCNTNEIQGCKVEDLVNTYDNTILYTDFILTKIIELLEKNTQLNTSMFYISDHVESLGE